MAEREAKKLVCFCKECGNRINKDKTRPSRSCDTNHACYKSYGYKYCPDCGKKLINY